ncbi:hypothetical protein NDU88_006629 [Pleurodeles waltl]|uniref:Uncharacterized protein n=1 Tax=Pleurodeles waltl TaxID=8319 RepID=A0AAV7MZT8_PLEWA|nr:hypothetical protein NDU88_006629 [Pleurodeles waltl]
MEEVNSENRGTGGNPSKNTLDSEEDDAFPNFAAQPKDSKKRPVPMCIEMIGRTPVLALRDTGASMNIVDSYQYKKLKPRPPLKPTKARIYANGRKCLLPLKSSNWS